MIAWLLALAAGFMAAVLQYGRPTRARLPLAALRSAAVVIVVALLLDAPAGASTVAPAEVVVDASASWTRATGACDAWPAVLDSAARLGGGRWLRFGDSLRADPSRTRPSDAASHLQPLADRASASGRPVILITDGEVDEPAALSAMPAGSRVIAMPCAPAPDLAVTALEAPHAAMAGDSVSVRVTFMSGGAGATATKVTLLLDESVVAATQLPSSAPYAERTWDARVLVRGAQRSALLRAAIAVGDAEPRNDTIAVAFEVTSTPSAVFASTAPDFDAREASAALRGATSKATRVFYRVAPGSWRTDGTLAAVSEAEVRAAVRTSPLVVLHGDTALFGAPRSATTGALLLFAPPAADDGEFFAEMPRGATSPLAPVLSVIPFDSLPPVSVSARTPQGAWTGLAAHRGGAADDRRSMITGWDTPRRTIVIGASGLWRWRFRGGVRADAYGALMGGVYDWLAAGHPDRRSASPAEDVVREGMPVRWRLGASPDSVISLSLALRGDTAAAARLSLRFESGATSAESPPLPRGIYDVRMAGGSAVLAVNASRELLPRRPALRSSTTGGAAAAGTAPSARSRWWLFALAILLLSLEWILRRRQGLR